MVGNDVIDLADVDADLSTYSTRFTQRVFTEIEKSWISESEQRLRTTWRLWAAKEAAYKLARRMDSSVVFSPRSFRVCDDGHRIIAPFDDDLPEVRGRVEHAGEAIPFVLEEGPDHIHALAGVDDESRSQIVRDVQPVPAILESRPDGPTLAVRRAFREQAALILGVSRGRLSFARDGRAPVLLVDGLRHSTDLSFSHHGRFVAWVWRSTAQVNAAPHQAIFATRSLA